MSALEPVLGGRAIEVVAKATRRRFTVEYKRKILREAETCKAPGAIGALLRREGLYSSHLTTWRAARERGKLAGAPTKRGPVRRVADPRDKRITELGRENTHWRKRAERAEALVELQKQIAALLGTPLATETRVVGSLGRPGSNLTGISALAVEFASKRLQLLLEAAPRLMRVAVMWHRPRAADQFRVLWEAARALKLQLISLERGTLPYNLEDAFKTAAGGRAEAVLVLGSPVFFPERKRLAELALRHRLPTSFQRPDYVEAGGLMSYGPDVNDILRRLADYTDLILKGAKPSDLPVEQPTKFELVINLKTAKALGLTIPQSLLQRADHVIE